MQKINEFSTYSTQINQNLNNMSNKQTSIEWLIEKVLDNGIGLSKEWREQAKEMHKQEIIDAQSYAVSNADMTNNKGYFDCEQYYQETFVSKKKIKFTEEEWAELNNESKGSDDHISDISKMVEDDVDKFEKFLDKEIELGLSPKDTIERIKWYYITYFKQPKKD